MVTNYKNKVSTQPNICFVCTDNIGRSLIAEYCLKKFAADNNLDLMPCSAGTDTSRDTSAFCFAHLDELNKMGIDATNHKRTQLTRELVESSALVVAMAEFHQQWIEENFEVYVPMFSEIVSNNRVSFRVPPPPSDEREIVLRKMVHEIYDMMPIFCKNMHKWITD